MPGLTRPVVFCARVAIIRSRKSHAVAANLLALLLVGAAHAASPVFPPVSATAGLAKGTHSITASYAGSVSFNPHLSAPTAVKVN